MDNAHPPLVWHQAGHEWALLYSGEEKEAFADVLKKELTSSAFASLKQIKKSLLVRPEFAESEFCLCARNGKYVYALVAGGAAFYLQRGGSTKCLLKTLKGVSSIVSGVIEPGDSFIMETGNQKYTLEAESKSEEAEEAKDEIFMPREQKGLKSAIAGLIDKALKRLPERKIVVNSYESKNTRAKKASLIGVALLLVLALSIFFGISRRDEAVRREAYEPALLSAIHDLEEAIELAPLSENRARELILRSRETAKNLESQGVEDERLTNLLAGISTHLGEIAGIYDAEPSLFLDMTIVASGFEASKISFSGGAVRVLDSKARRLVGIEVTNKRTNVIAGPDYLPDALDTIAYADRSFILSSDGVREVTATVALVVRPEEWESTNSLVAAFAGNIYVLDRKNHKIWRHQGIRGGFLEKEAWLAEGYNYDFSSTVSWSIDGAIWTTNEKGDIKVYSLGVPITFSLVGAPQFVEVASIFTSDEADYIYLLDRGAGRISVIGKNGSYVGEYIAEELSNATQVVADEQNSLILFLSDSKLYSVEAKHLE